MPRTVHNSVPAPPTHAVGKKGTVMGKQAPRGKKMGKAGKRHPWLQQKDNWAGVTFAAIRKLCYRSGVRRISFDVYQENRDLLKAFMEKILLDAWTYAEHAGRKTVQGIDIVFALKRNGRTLLTGSEKGKKRKKVPGPA